MNIVMNIFLLGLSFLLYPIMESILHKSKLLEKEKLLWSSRWIFLFGLMILIILFITTKPGEYKAFGEISNSDSGYTYIFNVLIKLIVFYIISGKWILYSADNVYYFSRRDYVYFCFIMPIIEEFLFRGIFLLNLVTMFPEEEYYIYILIFSSLLFSLFHINYNPNFNFKNINSIYYLFMAFIFGLIIGDLLFQTNSLWMGTLLHISINIIGSIALKLKFKKYGQV